MCLVSVFKFLFSVSFTWLGCQNNQNQWNMNDTIETRPFSLFLMWNVLLILIRVAKFSLYQRKEQQHESKRHKVWRKLFIFWKNRSIAKKRRFDYTGDVAEPTEKSRNKTTTLQRMKKQTNKQLFKWNWRFLKEKKIYKMVISMWVGGKCRFSSFRHLFDLWTRPGTEFHQSILLDCAHFWQRPIIIIIINFWICNPISNEI